MADYPEYSILNSLSLGSNIGINSSSSFEKNCKSILKALKKRKFIIIFPFYWTHEEVAKFSILYKNQIEISDLEWYLLELKKVFSYRPANKISWMERVNFFHSIACTRFLNEDKTDRDELINIMTKVSEFDLNKPKFDNLIDISSYNFLCIKSDIDVENPLINKALFSFDDKEVLINYAKYQIYYYGGFKECVSKMIAYNKHDDFNIIVPHTTLGLNWLKKFKNYPVFYMEENNDILSDLTNSLTTKSKSALKILINE